MSKNLIGDKTGAATDYLNCTRLVPDFEPSLYNLALIKDDAGGSAEALKDYTHCIDLQANATTFCARAALQLSLGNLPQALSDCADCDRSISLDARYARAFSTRGDILLSLKRTNDAIQDFTHAINLDPSDAHGWVGRGDAFLTLAKGSKAISDFDQALRLDPQNDYVFFHRGTAWQLTDENKAIADYTHSLELNPKRTEVYRVRGWLCSFARITAPIAIEDSNKYIEMEPSDYRGYLSRAFANWRLNNPRNANSDFAMVLSIVTGPDFRSDPALAAAAYKARAQTYVQLENYNAAIRDFDASINLQPQNEEAYNLRAHARYLCGNKLGAVIDWARCMAISPTNIATYYQMLHDATSNWSSKESKQKVRSVSSSVTCVP